MVGKRTVSRNHSSIKKSRINRITEKQRAILKEIALGDIEL